MTDPEPPDDLDPLLSPRPADELPGFREALFRQTSRRLAWGRRVRRLTTAAGVAAVFAAGGAAGWLAKPGPGVVEVPVPEPVFVLVPMPAPAPNPGVHTPGSPKPGSPSTPATAADAELRAEQADDRAEAARLYRLAGDRYLDDRQDYANAARCYRLFLARAGDTGLSLEPADTWLLTSLKTTALKEKTDATKTGG